MAANITSRHTGIVLDACCVMNLYASGVMSEVLSSMNEAVKIAAYVRDYEALSIYSASRQSPATERESIDLQPWIESGLLEIVDPATSKEWLDILNLTSQRLDDGEAISAAIAISRDWGLATDDRAARRVLQERHSDLEVISTPQLMRHWADHATPLPSKLRSALIEIESRANFVVGRRDLLYAWWESSKR